MFEMAEHHSWFQPDQCRNSEELMHLGEDSFINLLPYPHIKINNHIFGFKTRKQLSPSVSCFSFYLQLNESDENQTDATKGMEFNSQELATPTTATEEEVDECIDQSIQINSNKQMRMEYLYPWTLKFKDSSQETKYCQLREDMFRSNMLSVFIVWVFIVLCQALIIPRCTVLIVCLSVSTVLLTVGCVLVMAEEFSRFPIFLQRSSATLVHHRNNRTVFICAVILLMSMASSIGLIFCSMDLNPINLIQTKPLSHFNSTYENFETDLKLDLHISATIQRDGIRLKNNTYFKLSNITNLQSFTSNDIHNSVDRKNANKTNESVEKTLKAENQVIESNYMFFFNSDLNQFSQNPTDSCAHPEYLVFTWVLCLIALATGLKLYYLVKTLLATIMVCCYAILISIIFPQVFETASTESIENAKYGMPLTAQMNILLIVFLTMVTYHARLVEVTSRLDFIWKEQAEKELSNMKSNRILNDLLIKVCKQEYFE